MPQSLHKTCRGFTLIEVLIAMALFAILSVMAYTGLQSVIRSKTTTEAELVRLKQVQLGIMNLTDDLQQLADRDGQDALRSQLHKLSSQENNYLLAFTRSGWKNFAKLPRSTLQRVAYHLDEDRLIRTYWYHVDRADDEQIVERVLIENVESVDFRFLDDNNEWHNEWPTASTLASGDPVELPVAVETKLTLGDWGEITRLVEVKQL